MMRNSQFARAALLGGVLTLAACGGGGPAGDSGAAITGVAAKGLMSGTTVEVFLIDADGFIDGTTPLTTALTDEIGQFTLTNRPDPGPLLLRTRGGSYLDESDPAPLADKRRVVLGPNEGFEALLPAGQDTVAITPYSQMLLERARREADPGRFIDFFDVIRQRATNVLGFDPVSDLPADPINPGNASAASRNYAMSLGGFAQQVNSTAIRLRVQPSYAVVRAVQDDLKDGILDGQDQDDPVLIDVGNGPEPLPVFDFNQQIERFRNNNFGAYGGAAPVVFDEDVLSGPITIDNTPPLVDDFSATVEQGGTLTVPAPGLLDGTSDVDGDLLSVETTPVSGPQSGTLVLATDGSFEYTHDNSSTSSDSFQFAVIDGNGGRTVATAFITITPAATNRVYNTAFFELELLARDNGQFGEFRVFQERGFYDLSLAQQPRVSATFGPFESLGGSSLVTDSFGQQQFNNLFLDPPGLVEPAETLTVNRGPDGVLYLDPEFEQFLEGSDPALFERGLEDPTLVVPVRDDLVVTSGLGLEEQYQAIDSAQAPSGAYISGSPLGRIGNEFDVFLEIALEQATDFDVSRLQGNYGFAGLGVLMQSDGGQTITAYRIEHSPNASGVATGETFDSADMIYTPDPQTGGGTTLSDLDSGSSSIFETIYSADATGLLDIEYREDGQLEGTPSGLASPDGEIVIIQEVLSNTDEQTSQPTLVESFFQVGVRRPGGTINLEGQSFRWSMLRVERSANDQDNALIQFNNVPVTFSTGGACSIDLRIGQNAFFANRLTDTGPMLADLDDDGIVEAQACTYATGPQGTVTITVPGDQTDPNGDTYTGYISQSGDVMVLQHVRDEQGFFQRGLVLGYADNGRTTMDNRQPEVAVQPSSASVPPGGTLNLEALPTDPDSGPSPVSVEWVSTIGAFTSPTSATTQWIAPTGESGTTLLTAVVDDGQRLRIADVPVEFGQTQSLPKAGANPILGLQRFVDNSLLGPDDFDFLFNLFNPFDTRNGNYSCQGDGQQIPDGSIIEQFVDNDSDGEISAGDTASLTFNDCADFDLIRNGQIDFLIDNVTQDSGQTITTYSVNMDFNETLPNEPEYVEFSGNYDVVHVDDSNAVEPSETYTVTAASNFVARINESGAVASPINQGVEFRLLAGYQSQITRFFETTDYTAVLNYSAQVNEIQNDVLTGVADEFTAQTVVPLSGRWDALALGEGMEAGVLQGLGDPFGGQFLVDMSAAGLSPPLQDYRFVPQGNSSEPRVDVQFDTNQDGTFDVEVRPSWEDITENRGLGGELQGQIDARAITVDGATGDWAGGAPNVTMGEGDPAGPDGDVIAVWAAQDGADLVLRLDVDGTPDTSAFQYDWLFVPYNESQTACPEVTVDLDNFSPSSEFCQLFVTDDSGVVLGGCGTDGSSQPVFGADAVLEAAVPLGDLPSLGTHLKVFYGSAITAPPALQNFDRSFPPFCVELLD